MEKRYFSAKNERYRLTCKLTAGLVSEDEE